MDAEKMPTPTVALAKGLGRTDSEYLPERDRQRAEQVSAAIMRNSSPKGTLGLSALLDAKRLEYGITDSAFDVSPAFNTVLVFQVALQEGSTFKDSLIHMPETTKAREKARAPIGIIVSAGLTALDHLRSHGIDLGHRVIFVHSAPYFVRYDHVAGVDQHLIVLDAAQIRASYDLATNLKTRAVRIKYDDESAQHVFINESGKQLAPLPVES